VAIREILYLGDPVLRRSAAEVTEFDDELKRLVRDLFETMYHADGIGLAAPQVGLSKRVLVVDLRRDDDELAPVALVNPRVTWASDVTEKQSEGCLSIPGLEDVVTRPFAVKVEGFDPEGRPVTIDADALYARALQHEIDHLDGILFIDRLTPLKRRLLMKKWKKQETGA
jgi:peptide deformylase